MNAVEMLFGRVRALSHILAFY